MRIASALRSGSPAAHVPAARRRRRKPAACVDRRATGETITPLPSPKPAMPTDPALPIAAIVYKPTDHIEPVLIEAARALAARGVRLGGVLQHDIPTTIEDPCGMELEDLASGARFALSQDLGSGSEACRLDPGALAHAAVAVRAALDRGAALVFINKFGAQEASGSGLRDEMGLAVMSGVPVLTAVGERFLAEWQHFTGGGSTLLSPDVAAILDWWETVQQSARAA